MTESDSSNDTVVSLIKLAGTTSYCRPALRSLAGSLPEEDAILIAALYQAAASRDAKAFSNLYLAALYAERRLSGNILELGAPLLPDTFIIFNTALRLEGNVAEFLAAAIRSGRMSQEREATSLIVAWLDYERREDTPPLDFLALTRKLCRDAMRTKQYVLRFMLEHAVILSGDPVVARIFATDSRFDADRKRNLDRLRKSVAGNGWDEGIPNTLSAVTVLGSGATMTRTKPKTGRNDPCPCGSGRKFKQCCERKLTAGDQYAVDGVAIKDAIAHPELILSKQRIEEMRSHELYALNVNHIPVNLVGNVVSRLSLFFEFDRALEVMQAFGREEFSDSTLELVAFDMFMAKDVSALRRLIEWAPGAVNLAFDMQVMLASPAEQYQLLCQKAEEAIASEREGRPSSELLYCDLANAAIIANRPLGLFLVRGVLPLCKWMNQSSLMLQMEDTRDILGLDDNEPAFDIIQATAQKSENLTRQTLDVEKVRMESAEQVKQREMEIQKLNAKIEAMQETLGKREEASLDKTARPDSSTVAVPAGESSEIRELRDNLRRLKENLKVEHDERNLALRELRNAREQLRRSSRDQAQGMGVPNIPQPTPSPTDSAEDDPTLPDIEWERQPLRIPEYSNAFREALQMHPRHPAAAALLAAGRLAGGDPSIWSSVRALKLRPGILRVRVAGDYRLMFETKSDQTLLLHDFILRRDLERWVAGAR